MNFRAVSGLFQKTTLPTLTVHEQVIYLNAFALLRDMVPNHVVVGLVQLQNVYLLVSAMTILLCTDDRLDKKVLFNNDFRFWYYCMWSLSRSRKIYADERESACRYVNCVLISIMTNLQILFFSIFIVTSASGRITFISCTIEGNCVRGSNGPVNPVFVFNECA